MHPPSRPPNPSDGSTAVAATGGSGAVPEPVGAAGASAQTSRSNEERSVGQRSSTGGEPVSPSWSRTQASLGVFQTRSIFHLPRRSSSGYFSADGADSVPSSPLSPKRLTADKATQTPSPTAQVITHALERTADEAHGGGPGTPQQHGHSLNPSSTRRRNAAGVMSAEALGRQLRHIGDDYNRLLMLRRAADEHRRPPFNLMPNIHQEPVTLLCVGLMLFLLGRIIYLQGFTNSQDNSQV